MILEILDSVAIDRLMLCFCMRQLPRFLMILSPVWSCNIRPPCPFGLDFVEEFSGTCILTFLCMTSIPSSYCHSTLPPKRLA